MIRKPSIILCGKMGHISAMLGVGTETRSPTSTVCEKVSSTGTGPCIFECLCTFCWRVLQLDLRWHPWWWILSGGSIPTAFGSNLKIVGAWSIFQCFGTQWCWNLNLIPSINAYMIKNAKSNQSRVVQVTKISFVGWRQHCERESGSKSTEQLKEKASIHPHYLHPGYCLQFSKQALGSKTKQPLPNLAKSLQWVHRRQLCAVRWYTAL